MAKKKTKDDEAADGAEASGGGKKKIVLIVVGALVAAFAVKTFVLKPAPPTAAEAYAAEQTTALEAWAECAAANHVPFDPDVAAAEYEAEHPPPAADEPAAEGEGEDGAGEHAEDPAPAETGDSWSGPAGGLGVRARPASAGGAVPGHPVLEVDAITINLADDHYLKVGLGLELAEGTDPEAAATHGTGAPALDLLIRTLSNKTMDELRPVEVRAELQAEIGNDLCREASGMIRRVYFTDFVMQ